MWFRSWLGVRRLGLGLGSAEDHTDPFVQEKEKIGLLAMPVHDPDTKSLKFRTTDKLEEG